MGLLKNQKKEAIKMAAKYDYIGANEILRAGTPLQQHIQYGLQPIGKAISFGPEVDAALSDIIVYSDAAGLFSVLGGSATLSANAAQGATIANLNYGSLQTIHFRASVFGGAEISSDFRLGTGGNIVVSDPAGLTAGRQIFFDGVIFLSSGPIT